MSGPSYGLVCVWALLTSRLSIAAGETIGSARRLEPRSSTLPFYYSSVFWHQRPRVRAPAHRPAKSSMRGRMGDPNTAKGICRPACPPAWHRPPRRNEVRLGTRDGRQAASRERAGECGWTSSAPGGCIVSPRQLMADGPRCLERPPASGNKLLVPYAGHIGSRICIRAVTACPGFRTCLWGGERFVDCMYQKHAPEPPLTRRRLYPLYHDPLSSSFESSSSVSKLPISSSRLTHHTVLRG